MREFRTNIIDSGRKAPDGRSMSHMVLGLTIKSLDDEGRGAGYLSVFGNEDSYGDIVDPGAYTKTIAERNSDNPLPFLWQHYTDEPIGIYTRLAEDDNGLYTEFQYAMEVQKAREAHALAKMKAVKGMSIGFTTVKDVIDAGVRRLKELRLWEGSQVTFPANDLAMITAVKSPGELWATIERLSAELEDLKKGTKPSPDAAVSALLGEIRGALGTGRAAHQGDEPDMSTRASRQAVADLRREASEYLDNRVEV